MNQVDACRLLGRQLNWEDLFRRLDDVDPRISIVVTGGGSGSIANCFRRSGASRHLVEAVIPYSRRAVAEYLGHALDSPSVCEETAVALAAAAHARAKRLDDLGAGNPVGIALTAALPTTPPRDHVDAIYVAIQSGLAKRVWYAPLTRGEYDRTQAEDIADAMIFDALDQVSESPSLGRVEPKF